MGVLAITPTSVELPIGGVWNVYVSVTDVDGVHVDAAPVVTVTLPSGSTATPTVETIAAGLYRATYAVGSSGRYVARAVSNGYGAADFAAYVSATTAATGLPDVAAVRSYAEAMGGLSKWSDEELQSALDAEASAQRRVCRVGAVYPPDLAEALKRRVVRNLNMRPQPGVQVTDDGRPVFAPTTDPEVRRLERPYRKLVSG